ncbi:MAG TPA: ribonuclease III [Planctomycetota bacterium]|jgi:ribonuclease-3|nr:ribonuclease III [Planctomycetota bacterium]
MAQDPRALSEAAVRDLQERLGYTFGDPDFARKALTHSSAKSVFPESNERLEFLGDAVLGFVISEHLFAAYPEFEEGRMTKAKSHIVSRKTLARIGAQLELESFVIVGKMFASKDAISASILSNAVEAILAAIYLDGGLIAAREFVLRHWDEAIDEAVAEPGKRDYKSLLVQWSQKEKLDPPGFHVLSSAGPDHTKTFEIIACIGRRRFPAAFGRNKKEASQRAARLALLELGLI